MVDSSIAMGYRPVQIDNPLNQLAQLLQIQQAQKQGQLADLNMQTAQRGFDEQNKLRDYFAKGDPNSPDFVRGLYGISPDKGMAYEKARDDRLKDLAETKAKEASTDKIRSEIVDGRLKQSRQFLDQVQTPEQYLAWHEGNHADPVLGPLLKARGVTADSARAQIEQALAQPGGFQQLVQRSALGLEKFTEFNKPTYQTQNTGDRTTLLALPGLGGAPTTISSAAINQSPDNAATVGASIDNNKRTVGAAYDNANATRAVAAATRDAASIQANFAAEQGLRKEFEGLPEVKNYKQAYPAYAAVVDAAGRNTPQSDINLVYGIAKLYDPTSVVREGEYATVANSPNIPERIKGFAQYLAGGGRLSPETKRQIVAEAQGRMGTYEAETQKAKSSYETIARKRGMDPASVFADMGNMTTNPNAKPPANLLPTLPPADSSNRGKRARDTQTGKTYKSNGTAWVEE